MKNVIFILSLLTIVSCGEKVSDTRCHDTVLHKDTISNAVCPRSDHELEIVKSHDNYNTYICRCPKRILEKQ